MGILFTFLSAVIFTEVVGYFIHRLLHSERVPFLSRGHMIHHLKIYGPEKGLREKGYTKSTQDRFSFLGVGLEWVLPIALVLGVTWVIMSTLGFQPVTIIVFSITALAWGFIGFGYMHDSMHLLDFWMERSPLRKWYLRIRKYHDIHHLEFTDDGKLQKNYGICFFVLDRVFGSFSTSHKKFNRVGYEASSRTYSYIFK